MNNVIILGMQPVYWNFNYKQRCLLRAVCGYLRKIIDPVGIDIIPAKKIIVKAYRRQKLYRYLLGTFLYKRAKSDINALDKLYSDVGQSVKILMNNDWRIRGEIRGPIFEYYQIMDGRDRLYQRAHVYRHVYLLLVTGKHRRLRVVFKNLRGDPDFELINVKLCDNIDQLRINFGLFYAGILLHVSQDLFIEVFTETGENCMGQMILHGAMLPYNVRKNFMGSVNRYKGISVDTFIGDKREVIAKSTPYKLFTDHYKVFAADN